MVRLKRQTVVAWRLNWVDRPEGRVAYLGRWRIGEVVRKRTGRQVAYVAHLHVPGINGPIATENNVMGASMRLREKLREWLDGLEDDVPEPVEERTRVRRVK
jgi:hypothetical protein